MGSKTAPIPIACEALFRGGIQHPDLWLWDSWTMQEPSGIWHLYCLALSRTSESGAPIRPPQRNDYAFHIRHFMSSDAGTSWRDMGALLVPGNMQDGADERNVWSGSVYPLSDQRVAFGYTGVRECGPDRQFVQTICVGTGPTPAAPTEFTSAALSCPLRDYDTIRAMGYYLGPRQALGSNSGEEGGPILAWRDPFLFRSDDGQLHAFWSAKRAHTVPVIAHAKLKESNGQVLLDELMPPIELPDAYLYTQAEVPKVYRDPSTGDYVLLVSACNRMFEGQPDSEINQEQRLYRSVDLRGPWLPVCERSSLLGGLDFMFGSSLVELSLDMGELKIVGPYTENGGPDRQLSFSPTVTLKLDLSLTGVDAQTA